MSSSAPVPKFRRSWTRIRDYSTERAFRQLLRQHDLAHVPTVLLKQFVELGVRSSQFNRKIRELEKEAEDNGGKMDADAWARWTFLVTEHRRSALAIATLSKSIFGDEHRTTRTIDLVAAMAQSEPPVEDTSYERPTAEDPQR